MHNRYARLCVEIIVSGKTTMSIYVVTTTAHTDTNTHTQQKKSTKTLKIFGIFMREIYAERETEYFVV